MPIAADPGTLVGVIGVALALISLFYAIYVQRVNQRLQTEKFRFSWADIESASRAIGTASLRRFKAEGR